MSKERTNLPAKMGRASKYTVELGEEICRQHAEGKTTKQICDNPQMPSRRTLWNWLNAHPEFARGWTIARDLLADYEADRAVEVAENMERDSALENGKPNYMAVHRDRLIVDTLKWHAAKMHPAKYSDRYQAKLEVAAVPTTNLTDEQKREAIHELAERARAAEKAKQEPKEGEILLPTGDAYFDKGARGGFR